MHCRLASPHARVQAHSRSSVPSVKDPSQLVIAVRSFSHGSRKRGDLGRIRDSAHPPAVAVGAIPEALEALNGTPPSFGVGGLTQGAHQLKSSIHLLSGVCGRACRFLAKKEWMDSGKRGLGA